MDDMILFQLEGIHGFDDPRIAAMGWVFLPKYGKGQILFSINSNSKKEKFGLSSADIRGLEVQDRVKVSTYVPGDKSGKLGNAAAGAVLGFLLAGPVGTAIGAAAGSNRGGVPGKMTDSSRALIGVTFSEHRGLIVSVPPARFMEKLGMLKDLISSLPKPKTPRKQIDLSSLSKECPRCAEDVKLKAKICRFCGHEWSDAEVQKSIRAATKGG